MLKNERKRPNGRLLEKWNGIREQWDRQIHAPSQ